MNRNGLLALTAIVILAFGVAVGFVIFSVSDKGDEKATPPNQTNALGTVPTFAGEFGAPPAPQQIYSNSAYAHYDVQIHNRDNPNTWDEPMNAQHSDMCAGPPNTHVVSNVSDGMFVCADHLMTAGWSHGYGELVFTPSQVLNCSTGCTVQWSMSTERLSSRDWPDLWLTPWNDNLTLPFDEGDVDLQGMPRQGIHVNLQNGANNAFHVDTIANYVQTVLPYNAAWGIGEGIVAGTNQSAVRQTFSLTITPGHVKFERLASATAAQYTWVDADCPCLLASDYVVQFAHHSYNPTKEGAGVAGTWHWSNFILSPSTPFTLIHAQEHIIQGNQDTTGTVHFNSPVPANAYLRFSAVCLVSTNASGSMAQAPKQTFVGHPEHVSPYFIPIQQGRTSVDIAFAGDIWYSGFPCWAQDFHIWSKTGGVPPTPTPVVPTPTLVVPTPPPVPTATRTPTVTPIVPVTPVPTAVPTATAVPTFTPPVPTPTGPKQTCTLRWGSGTLESYGSLTKQDCANRGN